MKTAHVVTFHKCGSNWFRRLFRDAAMTHNANIRVTKPDTSSEINMPVETGSDRSLVLHRTDSPENVLAIAKPEEPIFLCLRDPKDVLISQYFSWKKTHTNNSPHILKIREQLNEMSQKLGQRLLVHKGQVNFCNTVEGWLPQIAAGRVYLLKYEDLLTDFKAAMGPALEAAGLPLDAEGLAKLEEKYSFSAVTNRSRGTEDTSSHYRKGVAGDWRNHFDDRLTELFDDRYGAICEALGYSRAATARDQAATLSPHITVIGFPKCATTALMFTLDADPDIDVLQTPEFGMELPWPEIKKRLAEPATGERILAHKFTAYVQNDEALGYLCENAPNTRFVLCVRDPIKLLISWHNMHRRLATTGEFPDHFAWVERDFYATCSIEDYYARHAESWLRYDESLQKLLRIIPARQLSVLSQESMARNMDNIAATLKDAAQGDVHPFPAPPEGGPVHQSYADQSDIAVPEHIRTELTRIWQNLHTIVAQHRLHNSL